MAAVEQTALSLDEHIPSSPPLPPQPPNLRKRPLVHDDNLSSDPLFSEDLSDGEVSATSRPKRLYRGPWWAHGGHARRTKKRLQFADSGVWMASERSDTSLESLPIGYQDQLEDDDHNQHKDCPQPPVVPSNNPGLQSSSAVQLATRIVFDCVDKGHANIDLSDMELLELPGYAIEPLGQMVISKTMDQPDSDNFAPLTPDLRLFLSNNALTRLPRELWCLENVTVLSLRNNGLKELPPGIRKLRRLRELNIAGNEIKWLPWELLELIQSGQTEGVHLTVHPNPLCQPVQPQIMNRCPSIAFRTTVDPFKLSPSIKPAEPSVTLMHMVYGIAHAWRQPGVNDQAIMPPIYAASSAVRYFGIDGSPDAPSTLSSDTDDSKEWRVNLHDNHFRPATSSTPSLFELAARKIHQQPDIYNPSIIDMVEEYFEGIDGAVHHAVDSRADDLPQCSVCRKPYLFKRAEWVEYWHCDINTSPVPAQLLFMPFMRRACSDACVLQQRSAQSANLRTHWPHRTLSPRRPREITGFET